MFVDESNILKISYDQFNKELNFYDKKKLICSKNYHSSFIKINNKIYHYKNKYYRFILNEIIGELVSEYFNLPTVKTVLAMCDESFKISNKDFCYMSLTELFTKKDEKYGLFNEIFPQVKEDFAKYRCLDNIDSIDKIYKNKTSKIINIDINDLKILRHNLKGMIVRDFITNQQDRMVRNFMFTHHNNHVSLMPLFDYEYAFCDISFNKNLILDNYFYPLDDYIYYLKNDEYFRELFFKALELNMKYIFKRLENEYSVFLDEDEKEKYRNVVEDKKNYIRRLALYKKN